MGVMRQYLLRDKRGRNFAANVADSVNIDRTPAVREKIIEGKFHRIENPTSSGQVSVEKAFFYSDFRHRQFFLVLPRWDRHKWQEASGDLREVIAHIPEALAPKGERQVRVIFGLAELREKLLAFDANLSERMLEVLKVLAMYEHPHLSLSPRLNLVLNRVTPEMVELVAFHDHEARGFRIGYDRRLVEALFAREAELEEDIQQLAGEDIRKQDADPLWINLRRWSSSTWAVGILHKHARKVQQDLGAKIDINSDEFLKMLQLLPRGSDLSAAAKHDLDILRAWSGRRKRKRKSRETLKEELWEIRFDKELRSEWALIRPDVVDHLWSVVEKLNPVHFEGNSFIDEIQLGTDRNYSFYNPTTEDIGIDRGSVRNRGTYDHAWFEHVVLHEVGHGVHERNQAAVDHMLKSWYGWERFPTTDEGIDAWVAAMGDYPSTLSQREKAEIRGFIRNGVGAGGTWVPPAAPPVPRGHPWHHQKFGPRIACACTAVGDPAERWYDQHATWYRVGQRCFFVNYWYGELMAVNQNAVEYVKKDVLDSYALMAPPEFFSELYATAHGKDPSLKERNQKLDPQIKQFLRTLGPEPGREPEREKIPVPVG